MHRKNFLSLSLVTGLGAITGISLRGTLSSPLTNWARKFNLHLSAPSEQGEMHVSISHAVLPESLQALAHLSETPLKASGNQLRGTTQGEPFSILIS